MPEQNTPDLTLRGLVHDLNNVFQTLVDAADLISGDPRWEATARTILRSVEHGQRLVRSVSQATEATGEFQVIAANAILLVRDFLRATHSPEIDFQTTITPGFRLPGNPVCWERVLVNLLLNSAQAMPAGGQVQLTATRVEDGARIAIADNGPGIAAEILPRIFDPHFSTKHASGGLGLHIVRSIVQGFGGTVSAMNRPQGGAQFVVTLPRAG